MLITSLEGYEKSDYIVELIMHAIRFNVCLRYLYRSLVFLRIIKIYKNADDMKVRSLYDFVCKEYSFKSSLWISYYQFELSKNEHKRAVSILKEALMRKVDYPENIISHLRTIESEMGSVESFYNSLWFIQKEMVKINRRKYKVRTKIFYICLIFEV